MENGKGPSELIRRTLEPLMDERETLADELDTIDATRAEKKAELVTVEKLLRQAGMIDKPKGKGPPRVRVTRSGVSDVLLGEGAKFIESFNGDAFSIADVEEGLEVAQGTARKIIDQLTERGELRFLGKRPKSADDAQKIMKWVTI